VQLFFMKSKNRKCHDDQKRQRQPGHRQHNGNQFQHSGTGQEIQEAAWSPPPASEKIAKVWQPVNIAGRC
jgi:hypothetical protein